MNEQGIHIDQLPEHKPFALITGFEGWGNALGVSRAMASYLIRKLHANKFAWINPEPFYRYDENRPKVKIEAGRLERITPPGGSFYISQTESGGGRGVVIFKGSEPNLRWYQFVDEVLGLCSQLGIQMIINVGSMYDDVLHSDRIISCIASSEELLFSLRQKNVTPISYKGPGGIHSTLHSEAQKRGFNCVSIWGHCPYYLQGATHFGMLSQMASLLSFLCKFDLDLSDLEASWKELKRQIQDLIEENPELNAMISGLRKAKVRGSWASMKDAGRKNGKIIQLKDFLEPT